MLILATGLALSQESSRAVCLQAAFVGLGTKE